MGPKQAHGRSLGSLKLKNSKNYHAIWILDTIRTTSENTQRRKNKLKLLSCDFGTKAIDFVDISPDNRGLRARITIGVAVGVGVRLGSANQNRYKSDNQLSFFDQNNKISYSAIRAVSLALSVPSLFVLISVFVIWVSFVVWDWTNLPFIR